MGKDDKKKESKASASETASSRKDTAPSKSAAEASNSGASDRPIDSQTFLRNMAVRHGLDATEYLTSRSERDWEKLMVAMAGRIFNRLADSEPNESCRANAFGS